MLQTAKSTQSFTIPGGTAGLLHQQLGTSNLSVALVTMDGVYPASGWSLNDVCTETILVVSGSLEVDIDDETFTIREGDMLSVLPGKKYRVRGAATTVDIITPQWNKQQNHIIDE